VRLQRDAHNKCVQPTAHALSICVLAKIILEANGFQIKENLIRGDEGFDFLGRVENEVWAIEVKYYRTARVRASLIESAATRVVNNGSDRNAARGMLVVSSLLSKNLREELEKRYSIIFIDRTDLRAMASSFPDALDRLDALLETDPNTFIQGSYKSNVLIRSKEKIDKTSVPPNDSEGTDLCRRLRRLGRGKTTWALYEKLCIDILRYLFANDLEGWHAQKSIDGGLHRYDYVCRVKTTTEFWRLLVENLNSRYIVFEFKNYTHKIKQGQILTTEKYLLEKGLRKVAIVLTRLGSDKNANSIMQGAMREHGKLILCLNDDAVCEMLHMKERGEDPTDFLFEKTDEFLLTLAR